MVSITDLQIYSQSHLFLYNDNLVYTDSSVNGEIIFKISSEKLGTGPFKMLYNASLVNTGNTFDLYYSFDGVTWTYSIWLNESVSGELNIDIYNTDLYIKIVSTLAYSGAYSTFTINGVSMVTPPKTLDDIYNIMVMINNTLLTLKSDTNILTEIKEDIKDISNLVTLIKYGA